MLIERELCLFEFCSSCDLFELLFGSLSALKPTDLFFKTSLTNKHTTQN